MMLLPVFFACHLYAILSAASVTFPPITFKVLLVSSTTNSTDNPVPPECQQTCAPIVPLTLGNQSCTPSLCCNSQWEQTYYSCILCAAQVQQITDLSNAQHTLDVIYADCALAGSPIPLLTFPGQSPNRNLPSASVLSSQTTATATVSGNLTSPASTSTSGSSTNSSLSPSSTASLTASASTTASTSNSSLSPSSTASSTASASTTSSTSNSGSSTRHQRSVLFAVFIISVAFSYL